MAEEEFQESEILFNVDDDNNHYQHTKNSSPTSRNKQKHPKPNAVPVNIPSSPNRNMLYQYVTETDGEMVPPHVIVGQRVAGKMTSFSVCTGYGRTLKGRDLSTVRNSVLRMTGFLET